MRLFFAFPLSDVEKRRIGECIAATKEDYPYLKWVSSENIHITLHFLGDLDDKKVDACVKILSHPDINDYGFTAGYEGFGRFPSKGIPRVYYINLTKGIEECSAFHAALRELLKPITTVDNRPFTPHITAARVKGKPAVYPDARKMICSSGTIICDALVLYESILRPDGAVYREIARKNLKVKE